MKSMILGLSASLRNARRGLGNKTLIDDIKKIKTEEELFTYLHQEAATHLKNFEDSGRKDEIPFDQLYKNLRSLKGDRGLSNSEVALAAALWSAYQLEADIDHVSLSEYFTEAGTSKNINELKGKLLQADGILLSSPVYFGDRGSLAQTLTDWIRDDQELSERLKGKVYAGIAVGAKRNGGQETTLIYQLWDMINSGFFGVGNDSETTSQYGGTCLAGDVGTMSKDEYGLGTSMGTGRRIARVTNMMAMGVDHQLTGKYKALFLLLQDKDDVAKKCIQDLLQGKDEYLEANIVDITDKHIMRCLACDICPTHVDVDDEYRCIIKSTHDDMESLHEYFLDADVIIPVAYSPLDRKSLNTNYQQFMERTRYLRRGDYVFSDLLAAPLVIEELGAEENLAMRMMTSTIRHHTIIRKPLIVYKKGGEYLNLDAIKTDFQKLCQEVKDVTKARLVAYSAGVNHLKYQPVGYVLSTMKDKEDEKLAKRQKMIDKRVQKNKGLKEQRLKET